LTGITFQRLKNGNVKIQLPLKTVIVLIISGTYPAFIRWVYIDNTSHSRWTLQVITILRTPSPIGCSMYNNSTCIPKRRQI